MSEAIAEARVALSSPEIRDDAEALAAARIAGVIAAKKLPELMPLRKPRAIAGAEVEIEFSGEAARIVARVRADGSDGAETEALTAAAVAALAICDRSAGAVLEGVRLVSENTAKERSPQRKSAPRIEPRTGRNGRVQPATLMGEVAAPKLAVNPDARRTAFRAFMTSRHLRATQWAKDAKVPVGEILSFLTGRSRGFSTEVAERLARAAGVRTDDLFR